MGYEVTISEAAALHLAAIHDRATLKDLGQKIQLHVGTLLAYFKQTSTKFGRCVVVYWDSAGSQAMIVTESGVPIDVGWEVDAAFPGDGASIAVVSTPAGRVATTTHIGPYVRLGEAHRAIAKWCTDHGHHVTGTSWEVYDHPRGDDPPRTDVYYLLS